MSYQKRGAWKKLPKTTDIHGGTFAERPGNRTTRRAGMHGGKGFGPLAHVRLLVAGPRRRTQDPAPWETGNTLGNKRAREFEAAHRAARAAS